MEKMQKKKVLQLEAASVSEEEEKSEESRTISQENLQ